MATPTCPRAVLRSRLRSQHSLNPAYPNQQPVPRFARRYHATTAAIAPDVNSTIEKFEDPPTSRRPAKPRLEALRHKNNSTTEPFSSFLTDTFNRQHDYLRISITEKCNLRCLYCMPEEGVPLSPNKNLLTPHEILYLSSLFVSQGVNKIRLTGGEPTVHPQILQILRDIGSLRSKGLKELALTTNGLSLHRKLDSMVESGVTGVNLSLDTLDPFQFEIMTRRRGFEQVMKSIERILEMNRMGANIKLKINAVVIRGLNDAQVMPFVEMTRNKDVEVRFIEYMPFDGNRWSSQKMLTYQEMLAIIREKHPDVQKVQDHPNDTSKTFKVPGFAGRVGFITSMTEHFCGTCNRLRITSDGNLKVCLFGNSEVSLRDMLRDNFNKGEPIDEAAWEAMQQVEMDRMQGRSDGELGMQDKEMELLEVIGAAVQRKKAQHAGMEDLKAMKNRPMILIDSSPYSLVQQSKSAPPSPIFPSRLPSLNSFAYQPSSLRSFSTYRHGFQSSSDTGLDTEKDVEQPAPSRRSNERKRPYRELRSDIACVGKIVQLAPLDIGYKTLTFRNLNHKLSRRFAPAAGGSYPPLSAQVARKMRFSQTAYDSKEAPSLTHLNESGEARMVRLPPTSQKPATTRTAVAQSKVIFSNEHPYRLIMKHGTNSAERLAKLIANSTQATHTPAATLAMLEQELDRMSNPAASDAADEARTADDVRPLGRPKPKDKGDVLAVARIAGIQAAKETSRLIPLCHNIPLAGVDVDIKVVHPPHDTIKQFPSSTAGAPTYQFGALRITATVTTHNQTGVEMEALVAASIAGLTVYDMCKAVDRGMKIEQVRVVEKRGGTSGDWKLNESGSLASISNGSG